MNLNTSHDSSLGALFNGPETIIPQTLMESSSPTSFDKDKDERIATPLSDRAEDGGVGTTPHGIPTAFPESPLLRAVAEVLVSHPIAPKPALKSVHVRMP